METLAYVRTKRAIYERAYIRFIGQWARIRYTPALFASRSGENMIFRAGSEQVDKINVNDIEQCIAHKE